MLTLSSTPNTAYLLHLAEYLVQSTPFKKQEILDLVRIAGTTESVWELSLRIANLLVAKEQSDNVKDVIREINVEKYICRSKTSGELKLLFNVLLAENRVDEVLILHESRYIDERFTSKDDFDIRIKTANRLMLECQTDRAEKLVSEINVEKIYSENQDFTDGHAKIGWSLYWSAKEYEKVIQYCEIDKKDDRLSPSWQLNYAQAIAAVGEVDRAMVLVKQAYQQNSDLQDGYARCAWQYYWPRKEYEKVIQYCELDKKNDRLSPVWQLNLAQAIAAKGGNIVNAEKQVAIAYNENSALKNGYSRIAWTRYIPEDMAYDRVISYFEKDVMYDRLQGEWQLNYAKVLLLVDKVSEAERVIENAYISNDKLKNGYARCGFYYYFVFGYNPKKALEWFQRDLALNRISGMWSIYYAAILAALGNIETAMSTVEQAYRKEPNLHKGYSLIAWHGHMIRNNDPRKALLTYMLDKKHCTINSLAVEMLAGIYMHLGNKKKAEQLIKECYKKNPGANGCNILIGICNYIRTDNIDYLYLQFKKDEEENRMNRPIYEYLYAAVLWKYNRINRSEFYLRKALERSSLAKNHAFSWIKRLGCSNEQFHQFIDPQFDCFCGDVTRHPNSFKKS